MSRAWQPPPGGPPKLIKRKWWEYLPFGRQHFNDRYAAYQEEYDRYLRDEEREYWDPGNQSDRFREAGFNPNQYYGELGGDFQSNAKSRDIVEDQKTINPLSILGQFTDLKIKSAQADAIKQQTRVNIQKESVEEMRQQLMFAQKGLTESQRNDMIAKVNAASQNMRKLKERGAHSGYESEALNKYHKESEEARLKKAQADMEEGMVKWMTSSNLSKWIPLITGAMRLYK